MTRILSAVAMMAASALALCAPASAQGFDDAALAAINASIVGHWSGATQEMDLETGAVTEGEDAFTFVTTGADGLDSAFWSAAGLTLSDYQGDGLTHNRSWSADGTLTETTSHLGGVSGPDEAGDWSITESSMRTAPDGSQFETRDIYSMADGAFMIESQARPAGADDDFVTVFTAAYAKTE